MPHVILEYSSNLGPSTDLREFFSLCHNILVNAGISRDNCKSRAISRDTYYVADGGSETAFAHLDVRILEGRTTEVKEALGRHLLAAVRDLFNPPGVTNLQITVEVRDMAKNAYFKHPPGTLDYRSPH
jgi:5-carboxymethyl-2-hydroxymuconate isomerase